MIVTDSEKTISALCSDWRAEGLSVGLVPTMGALHRGHLSLVKTAVASVDRVVVSIFVNPTQFAAGEDLDRYPRTLQQDCEQVKKAGACAVFTPDTVTVYPEGFSSEVRVSGITEGLCGAYRPGHFDGVSTVCAVLFGIVKPEVAVFGMKDAQQLAVIRRMVSDLRMGVDIVAAPIVREADGLAMSSRNRYLSVEERGQAVLINTGLEKAVSLCRGGEKNCAVLKEAFLQTVSNASKLRVQYAEIVDPDTLLQVETAEKTVLLAVAVFAGKTRLIDNVLIRPEV
ncbi:MAG: pantoate--beta-alanine ligase [Candidatus Fermentibacteraceae bacterium]|nr:pantoate--beta-alanine ligase [Candidatus Fermentibacteraceae bacterium]